MEQVRKNSIKIYPQGYIFGQGKEKKRMMKQLFEDLHEQGNRSR